MSTTPGVHDSSLVDADDRERRLRQLKIVAASSPEELLKRARALRFMNARYMDSSPDKVLAAANYLERMAKDAMMREAAMQEVKKSNIADEINVPLRPLTAARRRRVNHGEYKKASSSYYNTKSASHSSSQQQSLSPFSSIPALKSSFTSTTSSTTQMEKSSSSQPPPLTTDQLRDFFCHTSAKQLQQTMAQIEQDPILKQRLLQYSKAHSISEQALAAEVQKLSKLSETQLQQVIGHWNSKQQHQQAYSINATTTNNIALARRAGLARSRSWKVKHRFVLYVGVACGFVAVAFAYLSMGNTNNFVAFSLGGMNSGNNVGGLPPRQLHKKAGDI